MNSRLIRVLLLVIAIAIGTVAGYFLKDLDRTMAADRAASDALRDQARTLMGKIADVRAAQVAYVAQGQGEDFWMSHVSKVLPTLEQQMADFQVALVSPAAQAAFEPAVAAMENFQKLDSRARDFVMGGSALLAADLIFSDGLEATGTASTQVEAALYEELRTRQAGGAGMRTRQIAILGGGAAAILLLLVILGFTGAAPRSEPAPVGLGQLSRYEAGPDKPVLGTALPNLIGAARVCTDLARASESSALPDLLERTAKVIDASGIVVWIADPDGRQLRPATSFGYPDAVMSRMGSIPREANNAAAAAYRAAEMRTVAGDGFTNGALVAPLITPDGCIGVLSAEMKGGSEKDESARALAVIFAAQLATLVSPPAAAGVKTAAQA